MKRIELLLIIAVSVLLGICLDYGSTWYQLRAVTHCAPSSESKEFNLQYDLKSWTGVESDVPTFTDLKDVNRWSNRFDPKSRANTARNVQVLQYKDSAVCVEVSNTYKPCFSLYDITER